MSMVMVPGVRVMEFASMVLPYSVGTSTGTRTMPGLMRSLGERARRAMSQLAFMSSQGKIAMQYQMRMKSRLPKNMPGPSCTNQRAEKSATPAETTAPATSSCQAKEPVSSIQKKQHSTNVANHAPNVVLRFASKLTPPVSLNFN